LDTFLDIIKIGHARLKEDFGHD